MVATRLARWFAGLVGGVLAACGARAAVLPEDNAQAMVHGFNGGGVTASGPALLVRKSVGDTLSLVGSWYVDMVSNASIDVVTTASPFKETRNAYGLGLNYVVRDSLITLGGTHSVEPDYVADTLALDVAQDVFGGMTTVALGFTRGHDDVGKKGVGFFDNADHWRYRLAATQILSPNWLIAANFESIADDGYLGNPYRVALVFGAAVPERLPGTRSSRAVQLRSVSDLGDRNVVNVQYRYFWDNWGIAAHSFEVGYSRYFGQDWLASAFARVHTQQGSFFYSNDATADTAYITRNRQLSSFNDYGVGASAVYNLRQVPGRYAVQLTASCEFMSFSYSEFTDLRTGALYSFNAVLAQLLVSASF